MTVDRIRRSRTVVTVLFFVIAQLAATSDAAADPYRVPSSVPAGCGTDATAQLQSWIDSAPDGATLQFERKGCYRVEQTLEFHSRWLMFDGNGATFKSFNPPEAERAMWRAWDSTVTWRSMTLVGSYAHGGVHNGEIQYAHGIDLRGTDATIRKVAMSDLGGDCVYFGPGADGSSGLVRHSSCRRTGRNAVSVTRGNDIRVTGMRTKRIGHIVFDVEPHVDSGFGASRVTFDSNVIVKPYWLYAYTIIGNAPIVDQAFTNNRIVGDRLRIAVFDQHGSVANFVRPQNVTIAGNRSDTPGPPPLMDIHGVDGLTIRNNRVPLVSGALAHIYHSCGVSVFGNSVPGGGAQAKIIDPAC
jgi:hypothetical protein